jgi:hypothetical protein
VVLGTSYSSGAILSPHSSFRISLTKLKSGLYSTEAHVVNDLHEDSCYFNNHPWNNSRFFHLIHVDVLVAGSTQEC